MWHVHADGMNVIASNLCYRTLLEPVFTSMKALMVPDCSSPIIKGKPFASLCDIAPETDVADL